jgi:hypothetical protein
MIEVFRGLHRPHQIEAVQLLPSRLDEIAEWCGGRVIPHPLGLHQLEVFNYEGPVIADTGDWIVRDERGKFYVFFEELFFSFYERAVSV